MRLRKLLVAVTYDRLSELAPIDVHLLRHTRRWYGPVWEFLCDPETTVQSPGNHRVVRPSLDTVCPACVTAMMVGDQSN